MASTASKSVSQPKKKSPSQILRERKITGYLEEISRTEEMINLLKSEQRSLAERNIVGLSISHKLYGQEKVSKQDALTICVQFARNSKRFAVPNAFYDGFLTTADSAMNERLARYQELDLQIKEMKQSIASADHAIQVLKIIFLFGYPEYFRITSKNSL